MTKYFIIVFLCTCLIIGKLSPVTLLDNIVNLLIYLLASYVLIDFFDFIKSSFSSVNRIKIPIYLIVSSLLIFGPYKFIDDVYLQGYLVESDVFGIIIPITSIALFVGYIWLGIVLIINKKYKSIGLVFLISFILFMVMFTVYLINRIETYYMVSQFFNVLMYVAILFTYFQKNSEGTITNAN